jgi:LacI family transcriptional regulator
MASLEVSMTGKRAGKSLTIQDVARQAGVSISTVSRVLNEKDDVAPATYTKVRQVIDEMGYASSLAASSMRSRRTNVIGLIMPDVGAAFSLEILKGVNEAIGQLGQALLVYTRGDIRKYGTASQEQKYVKLLNGTITDGTVIVTPLAGSYSTTAPIVAIDPNSELADYPAVTASNYQGALKAMSYLLELGHRRIGYIGGRVELQSSVRRRRAYEDSLIQAGIPLDPALIIEGDYTTPTGYEATQLLLSLPTPPTAIFAANDQSALGAMSAIQHAGLCVPHDISVIGFDNIPEASITNPPLTTIDQSVFEMGYKATEILFNLIEGKPLENNPYKVQTRLVIRESCQPLHVQ